MTTQYAPPWWINLPLGLTANYDYTGDGVQYWTSPQLDGFYISLSDMCDAYATYQAEGEDSPDLEGPPDE